MFLYEISLYKFIFLLNVGFCVIVKIILFCENVLEKIKWKERVSLVIERNWEIWKVKKIINVRVLIFIYRVKMS